MVYFNMITVPRTKCGGALATPAPPSELPLTVTLNIWTQSKSVRAYKHMAGRSTVLFSGRPKQMNKINVSWMMSLIASYVGADGAGISISSKLSFSKII